MPPRQQGAGDHSGDEPTVRNALEIVGFFDAGIPPQLYTLWRSQVQRGIQNWNSYEAGEVGINRWGKFCEWASGQPSMALRGQLRYNRDVIWRNVRILCDDIAKQARHSRKGMWHTIQRARAARGNANLGAPAIQLRRWTLPDDQELGQPTTGPSYMPHNPRGRAGAALLNAINESNAERARIATRLAQNLGPPPAIPTPPPVHPPAVVVPPGMQRVPVVAPPPSLPAGGSGVAGGPFAARTCPRAVPHRWPAATGGPPTSVRVHVITLENHTRDVACGGGLFTDRTTSGTLRVLAHTMVELELRCQPLLPWELGAVRQVVRVYVLDRPDSWQLLPLGVASDQQLVGYIAADYAGGHMLDIQVEVCPPGLVPVPAVVAIAGCGRAAPGRGGSGLGPARAGGAVGRRQQGAREGRAVGRGGAAEGRGGATGAGDVQAARRELPQG